MPAMKPHASRECPSESSAETDLAETKVEYVPASTTGLEGPDQVLASDVDMTWKIDGRVRIKQDASFPFDCVSVPGLFTRAVRKYSDHLALVSRPDADGKRKTYTYKEYESEVRTVAKAFLRLGLERHHSVAILGFNSPEWFFADVAAIFAGGIAVGIYTTNSVEACQYCAQHSRANIIVVEDAKQLEKILEISDNLPDLKAIIQYEGIPNKENVLSWEDVLKLGRAEPGDKLEEVLKTIGVNECCTLVYTSGTVGNPKAVMLSHDNLIVNPLAARNSRKYKEMYDTTISYLPLSHIAAQTVDIYATTLVGGTVYFADKNALKGSLIDTLLYVRPTILVGVPRVWEKMYEKMMIVAKNNGLIKTRIAKWAKSKGLSHNMNKMKGINDKTWGYSLAKKFVFSKIKKQLGLDRCELIISGSAPLNDEIKKYFMSLDMLIMDIYGMSECSGPHTCSTIEKFKLGTVGPVLEGFKTKIRKIDVTGEGDIYMGGRHVFMGYLDNEEMTIEAKDEDGWLYSGDRGRIDDKGFLYVTGRSKEIVITAGGENIPPVKIEQQMLKELPALSNAMLIGDMKKYLTILVTLKSDVDPENGEPLDTLTSTTKSWAESIGSKATKVSEVISTKDSAIYKKIEEAMKRVNEHVTSNAQKVQKFTILPHDFSIPTGELGPTLKLRRNVIVEMYKELIDEMYE